MFSRSLLLQDESPPFESDLLAQPSARWSTVSIHDRQPSSSTTLTPTSAEEQGRLEEYILNSEPTTRRATEGAIAVSVSPSPATTEYYQSPKDEGAGKQWAQRSIGPALSTNPFRRARAPLEAPALGVEMKQKGGTSRIRPESPDAAMRTDGGLPTVTSPEADSNTSTDSSLPLPVPSSSATPDNDRVREACIAGFQGDISTFIVPRAGPGMPRVPRT